MTEPKKRGRPVKVVTADVAKVTGLRVKKPDCIHDGEGGFLAVGAVFEPVDDAARDALIARGLAE